jgi:protein-ribulosamine 3-kinase
VKESLCEISTASPGICPSPIGHGALLSSSGQHFLLSTFHVLGSSDDPAALASGIAKLHSYVSPNGKFGFHVPTCCGATQMSNEWESSWQKFFAKHRLQAILNEDVRCNGLDKEIDRLGKQCVEQVVPRLLGALELNGQTIRPVLLHGDLYFSTTRA